MDIKFIKFKRLGHASTFRPIEGSAQECKTSDEDTKTRTFVNIGNTKELSTSRVRYLPAANSEVGVI